MYIIGINENSILLKKTPESRMDFVVINKYSFCSTSKLTDNYLFFLMNQMVDEVLHDFLEYKLKKELNYKQIHFLKEGIMNSDSLVNLVSIMKDGAYCSLLNSVRGYHLIVEVKYIHDLLLMENLWYILILELKIRHIY